ncbi:MAG: hypothetical protein K2K56_06275 [Lachnospiraceae bacterium]|nr:hypothetical protein [Lachnospiraceae bacterium]
MRAQSLLIHRILLDFIRLNREDTGKELDRKGFVVPVGVAVGYAVFNPEYDATLEDTVKRADVLMYQNKQDIKRVIERA